MTLEDLRASAPAHRVRRVLVVEDEYFLADDLDRAFRAIGAHVVGPVATVDDALSALACQHVDVALVDLNLQGEIGFAVLAALLERRVRVAVATGYGVETLPERYRDLPYFQKPFDPDDLARTLTDLDWPDRPPPSRTWHPPGSS